ncbi:hypothetical protein [Glycomyces dulcitolivorans]|uniref:hypothetical protein n=1 Tax=Glycomyces dulcitolivorans TaxID=2200759 RepID=UPI000DD43A6F|nr:hypothetical protein [Glycomyces dulcitolivorans]
MNERTAFRTVLHGVAFGQLEPAQQINDELDEDAHGRLFALSTALMAVCLERRFRTDASHQAIRVFVHEMRLSYQNAEPSIQPLMIEAIIRAFAGEEHLIDEVPFKAQLASQYPIIRQIFAEDPEFLADFDGALDQAERLLERWADDEEDDDYVGPSRPWIAD